MRALTIAALLGLCACSPAGNGPALPAGAVAIGEDTYMVPAAGGDAACPAWRMESPSRMVVQAIFYRKADGSFTVDRAEACP